MFQAQGAKQRVNRYMEAASVKKKPQPKKVKGKKPGEFHDKLDAKLSVIAKKYGVKISLQRNKTKMSSILVSGLKKLTGDTIGEIFNKIPNTSHVPNKFNGNVALFRVFGGPSKKMTASDEPKFIVTAKQNGRRVYWTNTGFTALTAKDAEPLDEETADKIERRLKNSDKVSEVKSVPATMQQAISLKADESDENEDTETTDEENYEEEGDDTSEEDTEEEGGSEEDDSNKAQIIKFINDNNIPRDALNGMIDKAGTSYLDSIKADASVEDLIDFVYDISGPDDTKKWVKGLANRSGEGNGV